MAPGPEADLVEDSPFDVEAALSEFLADPGRLSLPLPHMSTGQRRQARKLAESTPELRCESYGFGADRQMHLLKKGAAEGRQDDSSAAPTGLAASTITSSGESGISTTGSVVDGSPAASDFESVFAVPHNEFQVRNTFIHIESEEAPVDERAVQSMPHGMFRQCILYEASQKAVVDEIPEFPTTPSSIASEPDMDRVTERTGRLLPEIEPMTERTGRLLPFTVGALVVVEGLVKAPGFNGRSAVVQGWDQATGRYDIVIASPSGCQQAKIKEENLRMVLPCPQ